MRALTVIPEKAGTLEVTEVDDPTAGPHDLLVRGISAPEGSGFAKDDLVVGIVRRPDPVPCGACARGEFDMCRNDQYTERGIKQIDGFASELLGKQRGLDVHVLALGDEGVQPKMARELGATYHRDSLPEVADDIRPDVIVEATGAASVAFAAMTHTASAGIVCLTGVSPVGRGRLHARPRRHQGRRSAVTSANRFELRGTDRHDRGTRERRSRHRSKSRARPGN